MNSNNYIRKATPADALKIHEAHMRSIQEVCSIDHSENEIKAWGYRPFYEDQRIHAINEQFVYVVEIEDQIEGFLHFNILENKTDAYIYGLYLTKKSNGFGLGTKMMNIVFDKCEQNNIHKINLHSTITAHNFYLKMGFADTAPMTTVLINQTPIRCIPMSKNLHLL